MILCARINDFDARECQEYCIDNPRMKCRGVRYAYAYGPHTRSIPLFSTTSDFHIFMKAIAKHTKTKRETLISGSRSLTSFGELSGMQAVNIALESNFTNILRLGKLRFTRWIIVMRVKDLYCSTVYVCDCVTWKIFARNLVTPNTP